MTGPMTKALPTSRATAAAARPVPTVLGPGRASDKPPRIVVVTRSTELDLLLARHGTREQAAFFLSTRGQKLDQVEARHRAFKAALDLVLQSIPTAWRRVRVDRADLDRMLFAPEDLVVAVGRDGLVANVAKYLDGQPVIGVNPDPATNEGILVPHTPAAAADLLRTAGAGRGRFEERTMLVARLDDGLELRALNEVYVGHRTHQSSRYVLRAPDGREETQSSSGMIIATGTGATGWARSVRNNRVSPVVLPGASEPRLAFFVREAWPSVSTGATLTDGSIGPGQVLTITSRMDEQGVCFGDGIEQDALELPWGRTLTVGIDTRRLRLMR